MFNKIRKVRNETSKIQREIRKKSLGYILAGFAFVGGIAWNDAIKELIAILFPGSTDSLLAKFGYAILVTIVIVIISVYLTHLFKEELE